MTCHNMGSKKGGSQAREWCCSGLVVAAHFRVGQSDARACMGWMSRLVPVMGRETNESSDKVSESLLLQLTCKRRIQMLRC